MASLFGIHFLFFFGGEVLGIKLRDLSTELDPQPFTFVLLARAKLHLKSMTDRGQWSCGFYPKFSHHLSCTLLPINVLDRILVIKSSHPILQIRNESIKSVRNLTQWAGLSSVTVICDLLKIPSLPVFSKKLQTGPKTGKKNSGDWQQYLQGTKSTMYARPTFPLNTGTRPGLAGSVLSSPKENEARVTKQVSIGNNRPFSQSQRI